MTISEIAKTHRGRGFRRKGFNGFLFLTRPHTLTAVDLAADDWEFEQKPMDFQTAIRILGDNTRATAFRESWANKNFAIYYRPSLVSNFFYYRADDSVPTAFAPRLPDILANDWVIEVKE